MKKIIVLIMLICPCVVYGQQIIIHSPTAANLGLYGEIPVSYYTGTPNISIPLYEIKGKQVTVPIRLSYHPAGIRPDIHPGPVGLGWSLQAGGVISRTVRGNSPDESNRDNRDRMVAGYLSYAYSGGWIAQNNWKDNAKNAQSNNCLACGNAVYYTAPYSDLEPDEFNFSVLNISGKFYFDHTGQIQVQCDNPVKVIFNNEFIQTKDEGIELDYTDLRTIRAFKSFTIVDEQGTQYCFGGAGAIEFSDPVSYGRSNNGYGVPATGELLQATSWFLTQIQSADGADVINFEYERGPFVSQLYRSFNYYSYSGAGGSGWHYNNIARDGTLISPVYLKHIYRVNGEDINLIYTQSNDIKYSKTDYDALFLYAGEDNYKLLGRTSAIPRFQVNKPSNKYDRIQWLKLDGIAIKNTVNESVKQIDLIYNNNSSERLFLNSINIYGNSSWLASPLNYTFTYKNKDRLPSQYLTCITDHWGFNNGKPYPTNGFNPQNREPDAYYTDSGVLSEMRYPTGGTTQFEYELHDYSKVVNTKNRLEVTSQTGTAGGLRIKKITTDNIVREFFYRETPSSTVSSGVLNTLPQYGYSINGKDCDGKSFSKVLTRSVPVIPLTKDNEGLYIGYTYVCERISDGNGGYTQYHYTNHDNGYPDVLLANGRWNRDIFPSDPHCSRYFERGRLKKATSYNASGQAVCINETVWDRYGSQGEDNPRAFLFEGIPIGYDYCSSAAYLHYTYKFLPSKVTSTIYDVSGISPVSTTAHYMYNDQYCLRSEEIKNAEGITKKTVYRYAKDVGDNNMVNKNMIGIPVERVTSYNNKIINAVVEPYRNIGGTLQQAANYSLRTNVSPADYVPYSTTSMDSRLSPEITYDLYDREGNILQTTTADGIVTAYLWGYNNQYCIAKVTGATYDQVKAIIGLQNDLSLLRGGLAEALVYTYTYKLQVGLLSETGPDGMTVYYEYDEFNRLKTIKDHFGNVLEENAYHYRSNK